MARNIEFFREDGNKYIEWTAMDTDNPVEDQEYEEYPAASLTMRRGGYDLGRRGDTINPDSIQANYFKKPGEQLHLFGVVPSRIDYAYADKDMRTVTPTLLGMAVNESKNIGTGLTYSDDLSKHSAKLAKKGMDLGIVVPNEANTEAKQKNDIAEASLGAYRWTQSLDSVAYTPRASDQEVAEGRKTIRGIVQSARPKKHMGPQFKHPDLDKTWYQPELGQ